jgi:hypothetical protein
MNNKKETNPLTEYLAPSQTTRESFTEIINTTQANMRNYQAGTIPYKRYIGVSIAAILSGVLYALSSSAAGERWDEQLNSGVFFLCAYEIGGAVSNALFNAESYLTLYDYRYNKQNNNEIQLIGPKNNTIQWALASFVGFFTLLPIFYQAFKSTQSVWLIVLNVFSSLLNLPIYTDGAYSLGETIKDLKISETFNEQEKLGQWQETQQELYGRLEKFIQLYTQADSNQKTELYNSLTQSADSAPSFINALISNTQGAQTKNISIRTRRIIQTLMVAATFCSLYQNFGYSILGGQAGQDIGKFFKANNSVNLAIAVLFATMNLIPSLGFSIKGLVTIRDTFYKLARNESSIAQDINHNLFKIAALSILINGFFSGGTSDQANYTSWCVVNGKEENCGSMEAWISGIIGNVGAGWFYNLPQCYLFMDRMFNLYYRYQGTETNQKDLAVVNQVANLQSFIAKIPAQKFKSIMEGNEYTECTRELNRDSKRELNYNI